MSYNKLSNRFNTLNISQNSTGSAIVEDINKKLIFTNNFKLSDKIDTETPQIDKILIDADTMYVSGGFILQNESTINNLKLTSDDSQLILSSNLDNTINYSSIYLDLNKDIFLSNSIGNILISGNLNVNGTTNFINQVTGSIIYTSEVEEFANRLIKNKGGNILIDVVADENGHKNYEISNSTTQTAGIQYKGITYLSNDINKCVNGNGSYVNNKDIFVLKGNDYNQLESIWYQFEDSSTSSLVEKGTSQSGELSLSFGIYKGISNINNESNSILKYQTLPQVIILRPGNDVDNKDNYFSGDSYSIKIKNNDIPFLNNSTTPPSNLSSLFILDITNQNFINNLQKGFKWNILLDEFDSNVILEKIETNSAYGPNVKSLRTMFSTVVNSFGPILYRYIQYLPWSYLNNKNYKNGFLRKLFKFGYVYPANISSGANKSTLGPKLNLNYDPNNYFQKIPYIRFDAGTDQTIAATTSVGQTIDSNNLNGVIISMMQRTTNSGMQYIIIAQDFIPDNNFYFYVHLNISTTNFNNLILRKDLGLINNVRQYQNLISIGRRNTAATQNKQKLFVTDLLTNTDIFSLDDPPNGSSSALIKIFYNASTNKWSTYSPVVIPDSNPQIQVMSPEHHSKLAYDFGGLEYPTLLAVELPENHTILNTEEFKNPNGDYMFKHKNSCDFYLWGNKNNISSVDFKYKDLYMNGGWLRIDDENNIPYNQTEKKFVSTVVDPNTGVIDSSKNYEFKKVYKNLFLIVANTVINENNCFNFKKYSNFNLVYIGDNKWIIN